MANPIAILTALLAAAYVPVALAGASTTNTATNGKYCTQTADLVRKACGFEAEDGYWRTQAACINLSNGDERQACINEAKTARMGASQLCGEQRTARLAICAAVGERRYDPNFVPEFFESDFRNLSNPNRYMPLGIGNRWEYRGSGETVKIEILNRTKNIDGVTCIVQRDQVFVDGFVAEDTSDWFAQAKDGDVWYCGEEVKDYETFDGDKPVKAELVSIDGSFKAGRDRALPGIIFTGSPRPGVTYREEVSLANAEDVSEIASTTYRYGQDPELDRLVPKALAKMLCRGDCVVTYAFTAVSPGVVERKYFAPGIGFILQTNIATGQVVQLVSCNFDDRCRSLPQP